ncbi:hypothetical protein DNH61_08550 [Paenibacillus sambharensis]|uniref:DUF3889 domain-containing protein n=1 Tax=Paenibacillus sambharensis TaxID=1803190 RepID=A0A2W1LNZ9_9BACL|nr:DUF3889 domain-containing protein [Paenibacillus sambharensis]PZD96244.1 hypothetical protein DNH61_08550 [Paenibacillus sambharensis]
MGQSFLIKALLACALFMAAGAGMEPEYAKWGRLAMERTAIRYEKASIVDYRYLGRREAGQHKAVESFRLWLRQAGEEFGVVVHISVDTVSSRHTDVVFEEVKP